MRPPRRRENEQHADASDDAELDTLEFPEAVRRLL
jgi:hypothetical protein